jgi:hypothetical protein
MRVRIVRKPPTEYSNGVDAESLAVGRVYNLASSLASALMLDGYAELYESLSVEEKRERAGEAAHTAWTAADRAQQWEVVTPKAPVTRPSAKKPSKKRRSSR